MVLIVTTLQPKTAADIEGSHRLPCDLLEIRLDGLEPDQVADALHVAQLPVLVSCRREADGGREALSEDARAQRLRTALEAGASLVDIEHDAPFREELTRLALMRGADVVISHHDLEGTPPPGAGLGMLEELADRADVVKLATRVRGPEDVQRLFELSLRAPELGLPFTIMGVGDSAIRAAAGPLGMALVYTAPGRVGVPGQLATQLQRHLPRHPPPPDGFRDYVLLGYPVGHSLSPLMQNAAFTWLGEGARYRPVDVPAHRLEAAFTGLQALGVAGGNVTSPHKGAVFELCDACRPAAEEARAVNAFTFDGDQVLGHNTDGDGVVQALIARGEDVSGRRVLIVGAGGTARAAAYALDRAGAELVVANRTAERAKALAREVGAETVPLEQEALAGALPEGAVLFNATPVDLPVADPVLARTTVFDASYGPEAAKLARRAELVGTRALDGLDLLVQQGDLALRFWLDLAADEKLLGVMSCAARTGALEQRYAREAPP